MKITIIIILYLGVIALDYRTILKQKNKKVSILYGTITALTFIILFLKECGFEIPSPSLVIQEIIQKIF